MTKDQQDLDITWASLIKTSQHIQSPLIALKNAASRPMARRKWPGPTSGRSSPSWSRTCRSGLRETGRVRPDRGPSRNGSLANEGDSFGLDVADRGGMKMWREVRCAALPWLCLGFWKGFGVILLAHLQAGSSCKEAFAWRSRVLRQSSWRSCGVTSTRTTSANPERIKRIHEPSEENRSFGLAVKCFKDVGSIQRNPS